MSESIEHRWVDVWSDTYSLLDRFADAGFAEIGQQVTISRDEFLGLIQDRVYLRHLAAVKAYSRKQSTPRIYLKTWSQGDPEPAWPQKTIDGYRPADSAGDVA